MKIAAVAAVRSESDIIEPFIRHNLGFFDRLYLLDHRSTDSTPVILRRLAAEGLPVSICRSDEPIFYQGPTMTGLIQKALSETAWDFLIPLDVDEFVRLPDRIAFESALAGIPEETVGLCEILNYVPALDDDVNEPDVLRRITHRVQTDPAIPYKIGNVILPRSVAQRAGFALSEGQHGGLLDGEPVPERRLKTLTLFPGSLHKPTDVAGNSVSYGLECTR
jgi:hypothetical protein